MGLVLARLIEEEILIGDDIRIKVVDLNNYRVKLLIDAPKDVNIVRTELIEGDRDDERE